jgi:hypothetical protein
MAGSNEDAVGAVSRTRGDPVAKKKKRHYGRRNQAGGRRSGASGGRWRRCRANGSQNIANNNKKNKGMANIYEKEEERD